MARRTLRKHDNGSSSRLVQLAATGLFLMICPLIRILLSLEIQAVPTGNLHIPRTSTRLHFL